MDVKEQEGGRQVKLDTFCKCGQTRGCRYTNYANKTMQKVSASNVVNYNDRKLCEIVSKCYAEIS